MPAASVKPPLRAALTEPIRQTSYVYQPPSHRLLFRGSLSVPGTRILLEGLTFTIPLDKAANLLDNPLALALESMRGRTLALSGTAPLDSVYLDTSSDVSVDIHPAASLTQLYFRNYLCMEPITSANGTTDVGIRLTLGDPETESSSDILIYGKLPDEKPVPLDASTSSSSRPPPTLRLLAARILPAPALPRPDDPAPRMPPLISFGKKRAASDAPVTQVQSHKRLKSEDGPMVKKARAVMQGVLSADVTEAGARARVGLSRAGSLRAIDDEAQFKVPSLPSSGREKGKEKKGAGAEVDKVDVPDIVRELEKANKATIKRAASDCLQNQYGIGRNQPDFKDIFNWVYRGAEFALRAQMQTRAVDTRALDKFVRAHAEMYIKGMTLGSSSRSSGKGSTGSNYQGDESQDFDDG